MTVPGVDPIILSAIVAAIGNGAGFKQGRDFSAWLGLVPKQEGSLTSLRPKRISGPGKFRSSPPKDFFKSIGAKRT